MTPNWLELQIRFPPAAITFIRGLHETPGSFSLTINDLVAETMMAFAQAEQLLEELAQTEFLVRRQYTHCSACSTRVDDILVDDECPSCHSAFVDTHPTSTVRYELWRDAPRDVPWVLVLHGMNTRGTWQEHLSWLIGRSYRRMIPVAIYKYGIIRPGVLFRWRQQALLRGLVAKIRTLSGQALDSGYGGKPDVIAHSFGTWMIAHAMLSDPNIRIGRLILLGCIVRPDFDWTALIQSGQVAEILNHGASKDQWVRLTHLAIPESGPGGVRGFPPPLTNVISSGLHHSDYFDPESRMHDLFTSIWRPFLTWEKVPPLPSEVEHVTWIPLPSPIRFLTRSIAIGIVVFVIGLIGTVGVAGVVEIFRWASSILALLVTAR